MANKDNRSKMLEAVLGKTLDRIQSMSYEESMASLSRAESDSRDSDAIATYWDEDEGYDR